MDPKITVGGKTYNNLKDLPPELQSLLKDENGNGIPDIAENPKVLFIVGLLAIAGWMYFQYAK